MAQKEEFTKENKMRWLSRMYFSVSDSVNHDVNPYEDIASFLDAKVGSLHWGNDKKASKERFCKKFKQILDLYDINMTPEQILHSLQKDDASNMDLVKQWSELATFPAN
jgi:hypothetical protein